jgi:hypothetical protein
LAASYHELSTWSVRLWGSSLDMSLCSGCERLCEWMGDGSGATRDLLVDCAAAHLRQPFYAEFGSGLPSSSRRICLRGPGGMFTFLFQLSCETMNFLFNMATAHFHLFRLCKNALVCINICIVMEFSSFCVIFSFVAENLQVFDVDMVVMNVNLTF